MIFFFFIGSSEVDFIQSAEARLELEMTFFFRDMSYLVLILLILARFSRGLVSVSISLPTVLEVCGYDQVGYLGSSDEYQLSINGRWIEDPFWICEALESYFKNGCFACGSSVESWRMIGEKHCNQDFTALIHVDCNTSPGNLLSNGSFCISILYCVHAYLFLQYVVEGM